MQPSAHIDIINVKFFIETEVAISVLRLSV